MALTVSRIVVYPVKSLAGIASHQSELVETGFRHDRCWMVIDENGRFLTQREHPRMALIAAIPSADGLSLTLPDREPVEIPLICDRANAGEVQWATVWENPCEVADQGDLAADLLGEFLGRPCRLVRMRPGFRRELKPSDQPPPRIHVGFADSAPLLLLSEASLTDLNTRLETPVPMNRFRPNLVVAGGEPYQEDRWQRVRIGGVEFRLTRDCIRCEITTADQVTGEKGIEPLATLEKFRSGPRGPRFGRKVVHQDTGVITVGDTVEVLE